MMDGVVIMNHDLGKNPICVVQNFDKVAVYGSGG
jgi:hypothetical protein